MHADVSPAPARPSAGNGVSSPEPIRLIRASAGKTVRPIPVSEVICAGAHAAARARHVTRRHRARADPSQRHGECGADRVGDAR